MRRGALFAWWVVVLGAWLATLVVAYDTTARNTVVWIGLAASVVAGALIGRWWVLAAPAVGVVGVVLYGLLARTCSVCDTAARALEWILLALVLTLPLVFALCLGVLLGLLARKATHRVARADRPG